MAADASALYARNVLNFLALSLDPKTGDFEYRARRRDHPGTLICDEREIHDKKIRTTTIAVCVTSLARAGRFERKGHGVTHELPRSIVLNLIVFVLAIFVGYHVVWNVTPALHTPLMSVTNAISGIILVGAMLAAGPEVFDWGGWVGVVAVTLASVNVFGGFLVTQRMLEMFKRKSRRPRLPRRSRGWLMSPNQVALRHLIASVCFIRGLKGRSHPTTARRGNTFGIIGMAIAVVVTLALV